MKKMIWLVDDDAEVRHAVCMMFNLMGYDSREFKDARSAAQALLEGNMPNMMFLDINMPEVSGLDLLQFIRQRSTWQNTPVLMISSESQDARVEQAIRMGADGYVFKPVSFDDLEMAIKSAFQRRKAVTGELRNPEQG